MYKISTLYNRLKRCPHYKERENYALFAESIITAALLSMKEITKSSFLTTFSTIFNNRAFTGKRNVVLEHREEFRSFTLKCVNNLTKILPKIEHISNPVTVQKLVCSNILIVNINGIRHTIQLSSYNFEVTEERLDFYCLNAYIYSKATKSSYPGLVLSLSDDVYFDISESNSENYTTIRGLVTTILKNKSKIQGKYCRNCENQCKPMYIRGLDRLIART